MANDRTRLIAVVIKNGVKVFGGDIVKVNDIVYFDNDTYSNGLQRYWVVRGRRFRKVGVPLIDLELQEVKVID